MTTTKTRRILYGDNGDKLSLVPDASVDMIYMDPPFGSARTWSGKHGRGFSDVWTWGDQEIIAYEDLMAGRNPTLDGVEYVMSDSRVHGAVAKAVDFSLMARDKAFCAYVLHMGVRIGHYKRVLKKTGNLVIHCDQAASHIIKAMVDAAFDRKNFRNEIIWDRPASGKNVKRVLARSHDVLLVWGRTKDSYFEAAAAIMVGDMTQATAAAYSHDDGDGRGVYSTNPLLVGSPTFSDTAEGQKPWRGVDPHRNGMVQCWTIPQRVREELGILHLGLHDGLDALDAAGYIHWTKNGVPRVKRYARWYKGRLMSDNWTDIKPLKQQDAQHLGYPTQKPVELLERLIRLYSPEGGTVLDPFGGTGTTAAAAENLGRSWTICDFSIHAVDVIDRRMSDAHGIGEKHGLAIEGDWPGQDLAKIEALPETERMRYLARLAGATSTVTDSVPDRAQLERGIHGHFSVKECEGKVPHGILILGSTDIAAADRLRGTAEFAVILCDTITDEMRAEAAKAGTWTTPGQYEQHRIEVPRVQLITVADAVARGVRSTLPSGVRLNLPYVPTKKQEPGLFAA